MNEQQTGTRQNQFSQTGQGKFPQDVTGGGTDTLGKGSSGATDPIFNLVSILYHALEGGTTYNHYIQDAQQQGDQELAQFFQQTQQEEQRRAQRAQQLLSQRLGGGSMGSSR